MPPEKENERNHNHIGGLLFIACMFIGAGLGMLFDKVAVGGALGMGVGFLLMAFTRTKKLQVKPVEVTVPKDLPSLVLVIIGALVIAAGALMLTAPKLIYPYLTGLAAILVGLMIVVWGLMLRRKR